MGADPARALDTALDGVAELDAQLAGDLGRLAHHDFGEPAGLGKLGHVDERRVGQRGDRIEREVAPSLEPDLRADRGQHAGP